MLEISVFLVLSETETKKIFYLADFVAILIIKEFISGIFLNVFHVLLE